jgi:hypothetical protein
MPYELKIVVDDDIFLTVVELLHPHVVSFSSEKIENLNPHVAAKSAPKPTSNGMLKKLTMKQLILTLIERNKTISYGHMMEEADRLGYNKASVSPSVSKLVAAGLVIRGQHGLLKMNPHPPKHDKANKEETKES